MSEPSQSGTVLCVGRLYCDLIFTGVPRFPSLGAEVFADGFGMHAGGGAFITAAHLAALDVPTALGAFIPSAPFSLSVKEELEKAQLDTSLCREASQNGDPQLTVAIAHSDDRAFLTRRSGNAFPDIVADDLRRIGARHVHIGEVSTLIEKPSIIGAAREVGATVSLDCGWDDALDPHDIVAAAAEVDLFLPSDVEVKRLCGVAAPGELAPLTVVKEGERGATAYANASEFRRPAQTASVVDTTGAGDAFNAGFISAWLKDASIEDCLIAGNARGAHAVSHVGGFQIAVPHYGDDSESQPFSNAAGRLRASAAGG